MTIHIEKYHTYYYQVTPYLLLNEPHFLIYQKRQIIFLTLNRNMKSLFSTE